ncbi:hypothetical protein [Allocoleopsis franciscana]
MRAMTALDAIALHRNRAQASCSNCVDCQAIACLKKLLPYFHNIWQV